MPGRGSTLPPLPPPPSKAPDVAKAVDIDWDDDDEKTTVFDRHGSDDPAALSPLVTKQLIDLHLKPFMVSFFQFRIQFVFFS